MINLDKAVFLDVIILSPATDLRPLLPSYGPNYSHYFVIGELFKEKNFSSQNFSIGEVLDHQHGSAGWQGGS